MKAYSFHREGAAARRADTAYARFCAPVRHTKSRSCIKSEARVLGFDEKVCICRLFLFYARLAARKAQ